MLYLNINRHNRLRLFVVTAIVFFCSISNVIAQGTWGEIKWLRVSSLHSFFSEQNSEVEGVAGNEQTIRISWPGQYGLLQSTMRSRLMWLGCKNYNDKKAGKVFSYKVIGTGPRVDDNLQNIIFVPPEEFQLKGKYNHPMVIVDGENATINTLYDVVDEIDESQIPDRMIVLENNTYLGVTVTKKIYSFTQPNHNNYFIYDYVLKNTGIINAEGDVEPQTLNDFIFYQGYRYTFAEEAVPGYGQGWGAWSSSWGVNTISDVVGTNPNASDFEFRAHYAYYGPHSERAVEDDWGCPNHLDDGVLGAAQFAGSVVLHADKSSRDPEDDPFQPRTTHFIDTDVNGTEQNPNSYDEAYMTKRYELMALGHAEQTHAQQVGDGYADQFGSKYGGYQAGEGFGPYTLEPGDSIHIVIAHGVAGISREKNREVGTNWLQWTKKTGTPRLIMPDGSETTDYNAYKKAWVWSCKDSLFKTFRNAVSNYQSNYIIPQPPPPPSEFVVESGGDRIRLSWDDNAITDPHFNGYVIYRSEGNVMDPKTVYTKVFECDASNVVHTWDDLTATRGFDYYYYIQSKDDGSQNDIKPGKPLYSSLFWTLTNKPAYLRRPAGLLIGQIRVVPNPYDVRARAWQFGEDSQYDRIAFYEIPPVCKLRVYTERGDLIWEKEHTNGSGDELWDSLTSSGQIVVSGIYLLYVEVTEDVHAMQDMVAPRDYVDLKSGDFVYKQGDILFSEGDLMYRKGESVVRKFVIIR